MKRIILWGVICWGAFLFYSCGSVKSIEVETYNPAAITFPPEVKTVLIINNSAQQPDGIGHRYIRNKEDDSVMIVPADSTAYDFCFWLGKSMAESPAFNDVRISDDTLRMDSVFYDKKPFSKKEVKTFCDRYGVDALLSLDYLVFLTEVRENEFDGLPPGRSVRVDLTGELRALWPGQKEVYSIPFSDSLTWYWSEDLYANAYIEMYTPPDVKYAMRYLSGVMGEKVHVNFVPYWSSENRWYYTSFSSEWKRGSVYAAANKWEEAVACWEPLLAKASKWKSKARLLSNLALCNEMTGNFEKAICYAEESGRLFEENTGADGSYTKLQEKYVEILKERKKNDAVLSKQLHEIPVRD